MGDKQVEMTPWHGDVISLYTCSVLSMEQCFFSKYGYLQIIKQATVDKQELKILLPFFTMRVLNSRQSIFYILNALLKSLNFSIYTTINDQNYIH